MRQGPGILLPLTLIVLGVLLLLANLGVLPWDAREALQKLWPLFLIAWGLDLMLGRRKLRRGILGLVMGALGLLLAVAALHWLLPGEVRAVSYPLPDVSAARISLSCQGCKLLVGGGGPPGVLLEGELALGWGEGLREELEVAGRVAAVQIESRPWFPLGFLAFLGSSRKWEVAISPTLPLDLSVHVGGGGAQLDLSTLPLNSLEVRNGVGEVEVTLPGGRGYSVEVESGVGEVVLRVPEGMGVEVVAEVGVGEVKVPPDFAWSVEPIFHRTINRLSPGLPSGWKVGWERW